VSELDAGLLVRRTGLLLRFYPPGYRARRGEEILGTLLETTRPGRGWPPAREVASVIGGGLRARRAANLSQGLGASLRQVGILAAAMFMVQVPAFLLFIVALPIFGQHADPLRGLEAGLVPGSLLAVTALAAAWCGHRWLVAASVAAAVLAAACLPGGWDVDGAGAIVEGTVLALVVLLPLTKRAERPPVSLLWLPCLVVAVISVVNLTAGWGVDIYDAFPIAPASSNFLLYPYTTYLSLVPVLVAACWLVTDVRPLAAVTLEFLLQRVTNSIIYQPGRSWTQMAIAAGLSLALTCALLWLLRHRARTAPPTIG
jgi:hypothetical protein